MVERVTELMVSIREIVPGGPAQIVVRLDSEDRQLIKDAALVAGISMQKFIRTVSISAAHQLLKEEGIKV